MKFSTSNSLAAIKPYEAGKPLKEVEREYGISSAVKLASNENPFGFSPKVTEAVKAQLPQMNRYPEPIAFDLVQALAKKYGVDARNIVLGNGSDDIIALLSHGYLNPGDEAVMPLPSFLMYEISVRTAKGVPVMVPLVDFTTNLEGLLDAVTPRTRMIFVTNPFNPTGAAISTEQFEAFFEKVPQNILVIVDEAYIEFVRDTTVFNSLESSLKDPRIVTLRTFSKAYGLAGFRVGYGIMDLEVAEVLNRIRQPFNVNSMAQAAAQAALGDKDFLEFCIRSTHEGLDYLISQFSAMDLDVLPSQSNFLMVDVKTCAKDIFESMLKSGVIVRSLASYGFETFLRINVGTPEENKACVDALAKALKG